MTDKEQEGALPESESEELVIPEISAEAEVQQPSVPSGGLTEDRLIEILAERDEKSARAAQSAKDRAISRNAKDIADILDRFEEGGSDKAAFVADADRQASLEATQAWQAGIESKLESMAAPTVQNWQNEWAVTSQKILDAAAENGASMSIEEVNQVAFNNGIQFETKADAEAALTAALIAKAKGEALPLAVVSTEGGEVAQPPAPPAEPKPFRQQFDELNALPNSPENDAAIKALLDTQWAESDAVAKQATARAAAEAAGLTLAE